MGRKVWGRPQFPKRWGGPPPLLAAPANSVAPAITGTATEGQTLTCSTGTWDSSPTSYAYQWKRAGVAIGGATANTYLLVFADAGSTITCTVTATNDAGSNSATSAPTSTVLPLAPVNSVLPAITGTATQGQTLSCSTGTWSGSPTYTYQWKRGGVSIGGATASTYLLVFADAGSTITCAVTATNAGGSTSATSAATGTVAPLAPVNTVAPAISGTQTQNSTLTCSTGTWDNGPSFAYQWKRGGVSIGGETASTYVLVTADVGTLITCTVTGTNAAGNASATSAATGAILPDDAQGSLWTGQSGHAQFAWVAGSRYATSAMGSLAATTDGTEIGGWADQRPTGTAHATMPTAGKLPTLQTVSGFKVIRFDGSDDAYNVTMPVVLTAGAYTIALATRGGIYYETGFSTLANASVQNHVGSALGLKGSFIKNLMRSDGPIGLDVIGWVFINKLITQDEKDSLTALFQFYGAGSVKTLGANILTNGDGSTTSGWTTQNCSSSSTGGKLRATCSVAGPSSSGVWQAVTLTTGAFYVVGGEAGKVSGTSTQAQIGCYDTSPFTTSLGVGPISTVNGTPNEQGALIIGPADGAGTVSCLMTGATNGAIADFDNVVLKALT